ncbi:CubicO group peptidase (beta-lactamase class C family) [Paenibacillus sp. V4I9]|nr:CubicO group peptidase (beta-lactamase class C family) [Paenibacillus sp. V4I9]
MGANYLRKTSVLGEWASRVGKTTVISELYKVCSEYITFDHDTLHKSLGDWKIIINGGIYMVNVWDEINKIVENYKIENHLSGTLLVSQDGKVLFEKAYGKANMQFGVENTLEMKFFIASVTKMFIAAAAIKLHEESSINLHAHPGIYIDTLKHLHHKITLHHLISHTSGLYDIYAIPNIRYEMSKLNNEKGDFLNYLSNQEQLFVPGVGWKYNSTGFIIMGYILEAVTGKTFETLLNEIFFNPLNMNSTGLHNPRQIVVNRAYGYTIESGEFRNADYDKLVEIEAPGELYSTVRDLNIWCEAILNETILSGDSRDIMFTPYASVDFDPKFKYGYGWFLGENFRWIPGGSPGYKADVWQFPEKKVNIIMLWNYEKVNSYVLFERIRDLLNL